MKTIPLSSKLKVINSYWHPHQVAKVDNMQVLLAKIKGDFVWHSHEEEDELFHVLKGTLYMQFRDRTEVVKEGEIIVVPKGVEHCPSTRNNEEVHLLLFENDSTLHTGSVKSILTKSVYLKI